MSIVILVASLSRSLTTLWTSCFGQFHNDVCAAASSSLEESHGLRARGVEQVAVLAVEAGGHGGPVLAQAVQVRAEIKLNTSQLSFGRFQTRPWYL